MNDAGAGECVKETVVGIRDIPFWAQVFGQVANSGLDSAGARRCAKSGHKWHDVKAVVLRADGGVDELARGAAQRCRRCGATRETPTA